MWLSETITHALLGTYEPHGDVEKADCVIGFSFGYRGKGKNVTPGLSNQDLANVVIKNFESLPKIFQFEIADAYCDAGGKDCKTIKRIEKHRKPHKYLDTFEVADQAWEYMKDKDYKSAIILAHPNHVPRVEAVCQKLGIKTITSPALKGAVEFDPQSTQKWTRNIDKWRGYEPLAIGFYKLKGYL